MTEPSSQDTAQPASSPLRSWLWGAWFAVLPLAALLYLLGLGFTYRLTAADVESRVPARSAVGEEQPQPAPLGRITER